MCIGTARAEVARQGRARAPHCSRLLEHIGANVCRGRTVHLRPRRGRKRAPCVILCGGHSLVLDMMDSDITQHRFMQS